jgi:hypothetical protein
MRLRSPRNGTDLHAPWLKALRVRRYAVQGVRCMGAQPIACLQTSVCFRGTWARQSQTGANWVVWTPLVLLGALSAYAALLYHVHHAQG